MASKLLPGRQSTQKMMIAVDAVNQLKLRLDEM